MNPLHLNDRPGEFPPSWYAATAKPLPQRTALEGEVTADVCIVGAGYTGLTAALTLAEKGLKVIVLEAHRIGWGASGRNGGQVGSAYNKGQRWIEKRVGFARAKAMWDLAEESKALVADLSARHAPEARLLPGIAHGEYTARELSGVTAEAEHLSVRYDYDKITVLGPQDFAGLVCSPLYHGGMIDRGAGHIHPLRYVIGLGKAALAAGAEVFEGSEVLKIEHGDPAILTTAKGRVRAGHVILAGNGYLPHLAKEVARKVMPINSFIGATPPLGDLARKVLSEDIAACDSSHLVNYFRTTEDGRLLFGGRANYSLKFPDDIGTALNRRMQEMFPQLRGVGFDHVWGGTLGVTMTRLPAVLRIAPNIVSASGYSGHGVALAGIAGKVMAEAVAGQASRFETLAALPSRPFPFGAHLQEPTMTLAMVWYRLRDRLGH